MKNLTLAIIASLGFATTVNAEGLTYDYVNVGLTHLNTFDSLGVTVGGSTLVSDNVFVFGNYSYDRNDDFDLAFNQVRAGVGVRHAVSETVDVYGTAYGTYQSLTDDVFNTKWADTWGYGVGGGVRTLFNDFELKVGVSHERYTRTHFNETYAVVGGVYNFNDFVAGVVDVRHNLDGEYHVGAGVRFSF